MNRTLRSALLSILIVATPATYAGVSWMDKVVAVAGDEIITQAELDRETDMIASRLRAAGRTLPPASAMQKEVLESLIINKLQLQRAREQGILIDDTTLERAVEDIARENGMSTPEFRQQLEREGLQFDTFREDIRKELAISKLRQRAVLSRIRVNDSEIEDALRQHKQGEAQSKSFELSHILISYPPEAGENSAEASAAKSKAEELRARAAAGEDFAVLARSFSAAGNAASGGDLGWRAYEEVPSLFQPIVNGLGKGEVSDVVQRGNAFHIVKMVDLKSDAPSGTIPEFLTRHILIATQERARTDAEAKSIINDIRQRLMSGADFASLAKQYSDDTGSGSRGGELGWAPASTYVPEFAETIARTPRGQVSEPFETQFGWHIVQVLEQRETQMTDEHLRARAREVLTKQKQDAEMQNWVRELRDEAYVEYRLNPNG